MVVSQILTLLASFFELATCEAGEHWIRAFFNVYSDPRRKIKDKLGYPELFKIFENKGLNLEAFSETNWACSWMNNEQLIGLVLK